MSSKIKVNNNIILIPLKYDQIYVVKKNEFNISSIHTRRNEKLKKKLITEIFIIIK